MQRNYWYVGSYDKEFTKTCPVCNKESKISYSLFQTRIGFFGMSFFPGKQIVYWTCNKCDVKKELKSGATRVLDDFEQDIKRELLDHFKSKRHIKNYWGLVLLASLALIITLLVIL